MIGLRDYVEAGILKIDASARKLFLGDQMIFLRNKEFALLFYFLKNQGRVLSRTEILEDVWDRNICCNSNTVDVHVSKLRKKLKKHYEKELIKTIHCCGYLFEI